MAKEIDIQVQEAHRVPNKLDTKRSISRHIIIKMSSIKIKRVSQKRQEKGRELPTKEFL